MTTTTRSAIALLAACCLAGCAAVHRQWGKGTLVGAGLGAFAGGVAGGTAANNQVFNDKDDETRGAAIGIGIASGAVLGAIVGHLLLDEAAPASVQTAVTPPPPPPAAPAPMLVLKGTQFAFNSSALSPAATADLAPTLRSLQADPTLRVRIDGHTDSVGSKSYNLRLSEKRAQAVKSYLVDQGIAADRVAVRGLGPGSPVADNGTPDGRARNRRVEIYRID